MKAQDSALRPADMLGLIHQRLRAGDMVSAREIFERARNGFPGPWPEMRMLEARLVEAERGEAAAIPLFRDACRLLSAANQAQPTGARSLALAHALFKLGELDPAQAALNLAEVLGADRDGARRLNRAIARLAGDARAFRQAAEAVVEGGKASADDYAALAAACLQVDDLEASSAAAARAIALDPKCVAAHKAASTITARRGGLEIDVRGQPGLKARKPEDPRLAMQAICALVALGQVERAARELGEILRRWPQDAPARAFALSTGHLTVEEIPTSELPQVDGDPDGRLEGEIRRLAREAPSGSELRRPLVVDDKLADVIVAPADGSPTAVLVFTDPQDALSIPLAIFDRYLAALGLSAIYLKDFQRAFYLRGVSSLGDSFAASLAAIRERLTAMGATRLLCLGTSAGAFAAVRYAAELEADGVLGFSARTRVLEREIAAPDGRAAKMASPGADHLDLAPFLASTRMKAPVDFFYAQDNTRDSAETRRIRGAPGVTLHPVAGLAEPETLRALALRQDLAALVSWFVPR